MFSAHSREEVVMREKKGGALSKVQKLKRRISHSFNKLSISKNEDDCLDDRDDDGRMGRLKMNGYSDEYLDRIEPNGNIPDKNCEMLGRPSSLGWDRIRSHETLSRQLSVSSDSKLLDDDIREEHKVIFRPKKPPRPKSEVYLCKDQQGRSKRHSAFGIVSKVKAPAKVISNLEPNLGSAPTCPTRARRTLNKGDSPFGRTEAYMKLDQLGEGSYATVYKGYSNLTQQVVALKEIRLQEEEGTPFTAIREASLLKQLKHANIVTLHDIVHTRETLTFVFEYVHTDLSQYLERYGCGGLHPRNVKLFLVQLLRGLEYCHGRRILHRDIKPQNLLISEVGELKIADFGLARAKSVPSHTYSHEVVTLWYRPPDVLLGSTDYSTSLDLWGVGCIFVEMITGVPAFPGVRDVHDQLDKIFKVVGTPTEETWPGVSQLPNYRKPGRMLLYRPRRLAAAFPAFHDLPFSESLASQFLQIHPSRRISSKEALKHEYFNDLPKQIFDLNCELSIFSISGIKLFTENSSYQSKVIHSTRETRNKKVV